MTEPGGELEVLQEIIGTGKGEGPQALRLAEFFEVHLLFTLDGDEVVIPFLVIPDEKVLGVPFRIRKLDLCQFFHVEYSLMLGGLKSDSVVFEVLAGFFLVHRFFLPNGPIQPS